MPRTPDFVKDLDLKGKKEIQNEDITPNTEPVEVVNYNEALNAFNNVNAKALDILVNLEA